MRSLTPTYCSQSLILIEFVCMFPPLNKLFFPSRERDEADQIYYHFYYSNNFREVKLNFSFFLRILLKLRRSMV